MLKVHSASPIWLSIFVFSLMMFSHSQVKAEQVKAEQVPKKEIHSNQSPNKASNRVPNIIYIMADDLGYGELGCYGQKKIKTPHIDQLAKEGMRFTQCYAGAAVCQPSRSVLMTGQHTGHTAVRQNNLDHLLYDEDVTIPEILKKAGYTTAGFGKWGLGYEGTKGDPLQQGFDHYTGQLYQVHAHFYYPYWILKDGKRFPLKGNENGKREQYIQDVLHEHTVDFIRKNHDRPFFAYLSCIIPHVELVVPEESEKPYRGKFPKVSIQDPRPGYIGSEDGLTTFAGMVSRLDGQVGEIMKLLKELEIDDNTIVIFTSDNGGQTGGKDRGWQKMTDFFQGNGDLRGYKGSFHEGGIRVPFIVHWKGKIEPGTTSHHICAFQDILPTLAEIAGQKNCVPKSVDGISLSPTLLKSGPQKKHAGLYWEQTKNRKRPFISRAARIDNWKAVQKRHDKPIELYNLQTDISEQKNVAKSHPEVVDRMRTFMEKSHSPIRDFPKFQGERPTIKTFVR